MINKLKNILFFVVISVSLFSCATLQKTTEKWTEQEAKTEDWELITSESFDQNAKDFVLQEKLQLKFGRKIKHWGSVGSYSVDNVFFSKTRKKGFFTPWKKTKTKSFGFEISQGEKNQALIKGTSVAIRKGLFGFFSYQSSMKCILSVNDKNYDLRLRRNDEVNDSINSSTSIKSIKNEGSLSDKLKTTARIISRGQVYTGNLRSSDELYQITSSYDRKNFLADLGVGFLVYDQSGSNEILAVDTAKLRIHPEKIPYDECILVATGLALKFYDKNQLDLSKEWEEKSK